MTTPAEDAAAAAATAAAAAAGAKTNAPAWHGYTEQADLDYVKNKGLQSGGDAVKGYREAEKFIGKDPTTLISIPRADDPNGLLAVLDRLGRPATADKYEFGKVPEGLKPDDGYMNWARGTFHEIGLLPGQVKTLTEKHNSYVAEQVKAQETAYNTSVEADKKALLAEWKGGHERMIGVAKAAAKSLGFDDQTIDGIERAKGYAGTWKFFAELGKKMGEPGFVSGDGLPKFENSLLTPAEAQAKWDSMKNDPIIFKALADKTHPDHDKYQKQQNDLFAIMFPGQRAA